MSRIPIRLPAPRTKYRAIRTDGYASKKEAKRAADLKLMERIGLISHLVEQPEYVLIYKDELGGAIKYRADFSYWDAAGNLVLEDVKGFKTPVYRLKRRLMWQMFKIRIQEV